MKVVVLADTHIPKRAKTLPEKAWELVKSADVILHAGDVLSDDFLTELRKCAPVHAVRGNNDLDLPELPETVELELDGARIAMIHNSGDKTGRAKRMKKRFPNANIVVFGHSHIPMNEEADGIRLFNPGSPTDKRTQPRATIGILDIQKGSVRAEIIEL